MLISQDEKEIQDFWNNEYVEYLDDPEEMAAVARNDIKYLIAEIEDLRDKNLLLSHELWELKKGEKMSCVEGDPFAI